MKFSLIRKPGTLLAALLMVTMATATGQGVTDQAAALDHISGSLAESSASIDAIIREGDPWELLDWSITVRPSIQYREYLEGRRDQVLNPRVSTILQVRFGERPLATAQRAIKLERALAAHATMQHRGVRDALLAHAELLLAQDALTAAQEALASADLSTEGLIPEQVAFERAAWNLEQAQAAALAHGLADLASYTSMRFLFPEAEVAEHPDVRMQQLRAAEAEARLVQAGPSSVLRDLRLGGSWRNEKVDLDLEAGLMAGRPGFRLGAVNPGGRARLQFRLSAEFVFSNSADEAALQEDFLAALDDVTAVADSVADAAYVALVDAGFAEDDLTLAEQELSSASSHLKDTRLLLETADHGQSDERELARLEADVARAQREVNRLTTRVYRAWITYVRRTHDFIVATNGSWELR